ncbi:hypothetical protein ASD77_15930 [Pseudoxanthomonas sp. Root65]|nr:hypothetical protein ASD77_15930 [Pseudoxanthomonas sp. Root65]
MPDHNVSSAAMASSQSPSTNTQRPIQMSANDCFPGVEAYSRQDSATICTMVLILPSEATFTVAR